jgi:TPR repeat protein
MSWPKSGQEQLARLRRHVENDVPEAINVLAKNYRDGGLGLAQSYKKAVKIYKRAIELGSVQATIELGLMYERGRGVTLDLKKASQLYRMAADRGNANAQFNIACILRGEGHIEEAIRFFRLAADQNFTAAEHTLGFLYVRGEGVERNYYEARRWFARAADGTGHLAPASMHNLGNLYRLGYGVERDIEEGRRWYERAAAMGDEDAIATLKMLDNPLS